MVRREIEVVRDDEKREVVSAVEEGGIWWLQSLSLSGLGTVVKDPHYYHTACCRTSVVHADSVEGNLYYRGYDMEELADKSTFLEVTYLLIYGQLPHTTDLERFKGNVMDHTYLHEDLLAQMRSFRYDAHPMGVMISVLASLSTFHPDANPSLQGADMYQKSDAVCAKQIYRILGKITTIAACAYRFRVGRAFNSPTSEGAAVGYTENFLTMLDRMSGEPNYEPNPELCRHLDRLFIALADDGMNTATALLRHVCSSKVDPYTAVAASFAALYGARVSGVGDAVLDMLASIGTPESVTEFVASAKQTKLRIQGFGHLLYKAYDPRCRVVKQIAVDVAELMGEHPLLPVAIELERQVVADEYFTSRRVFPNVDLYLSLVVSMMGFPRDFFSALVSIPRSAGFLAHWLEIVKDPSHRIARPRQIYKGPPERQFVPMSDRQDSQSAEELNLDYNQEDWDRRRTICSLTRAKSAEARTRSGTGISSNLSPYS